MKNILLLGLLLCCLCSCKKIAVQHTCTCEIKRNINGVEEDLGTIARKQLGTYVRAADSCTKLEDGLNYVSSTTEGTEIHTAECEIK